MSEYVYAGLTSQSVDLFLADSSSSTGAGLAGLVYNSAGLVASYRKGATGSRVAITLATQTVGGAYSSGGFVEIESTHMKGVYRLDIPNAAVDTEGFVTLYLYGATNLKPTALRIDCRPLPVDLKKIGADAQSMTDLKDFADAGYDPSTNTVTAVLDSSSRLAIWNTLTTETFTADSFGELLLISDGTNGRAVKVTGANHIAADVHDCQTDGLSGSTEIGNIQDAAGWLLAISSGAVANPQTSTEQYDITQFGVNYRVAMAGLTSTGTRTAPTLSKP